MRLAAALTLAAVSLAGCVSKATPSTQTVVSTTYQTVTRSPTPSASTARPTPSYRPAPARTVAPLPPDAAPPKGELERRCPYIASSPEQNAATNVADIDGSHVYRTTVLSAHNPVGCRFYFYTAPYYAIVEIAPKRFATHRSAYAAMLATAKAGTDESGKPDLVPEVDGIVFRTKFYGADGARDWACVFAAGRTMVIVRTQRTDTSLNAVLLARAVARRF